MSSKHTVMMSPKSETARIVEREVAAIDRVSKNAAVSRECALAFLKGAGIVTSSGKLKKEFR